MEKDIYSFAQEKGIGENRVRDAGSGVSPIGPSKRVKAAIRKAVKAIGVMPDPRQGKLRRLLSSKYGVAEDRLLFANSLQELLFFVTRALKPGKVIIAGPAPDVFEEAAVAAGCRIRHLGGVGSADLLPEPGAVIRGLEGGGVLFMSNPNRITGRLASGEEVDGIADEARKGEVVVVLDESLVEFTGRGESLDHQRENVIVLRTTAFFYGLPGLELAYAAGAPGLLRRLAAEKIGPVNHLSVEAARAALRDKTYKKETREFVRREQRFFLRSLGDIDGLTLHGSDTPVMLLKLDNREGEVRRALSRAGFLLRDCEGMEGLGGSYLRLSVMDHNSNSKFVRIIRDTLASRR